MLSKPISLSDFELELMQIFWEQGTLTAPEMHRSIKTKREVSYSTVKTIIDRLEVKNAIKRTKIEGKTIFYDAILEKQKARLPMVKNFIDRVFMGKSQPLAAHIISETELTESDIEYLEKILKERKKEIKR
ncbi:BlaI/MecI/CopY family transcriptional regulator [Glaciecola sp. MF2-115]|uniref:BlaI/MecI/CopY family transcriptional regulator n=1 Tax=Glaciecola sp. MF2-115 TaxID=3384827 RepID=UPI00399F0927